MYYFQIGAGHHKVTEALDVYAVLVRLGLSFLALWSLSKGDSQIQCDLMASHSWDKRREVQGASK